ncbi:unnamed protein product [marine sediment metagenome]|uniref:Uncharacterized protein n=1 Tax=marine sediment metagenome TaxID=412755 RepID=X1MIS0_9ZZZZ
MVGEKIQQAREQLQSMRGQMMNGLKLGGNLFSSNPGILTNFQAGKRVQERLSAIRGAAVSPPDTRPKVGGEKVFIDRPKGVKERVIIV